MSLVVLSNSFSNVETTSVDEVSKDFPLALGMSG